MKVTYITYDSNAILSNSGKSGVIKKIFAQLSALQKLGVCSELVIMHRYLPANLPEGSKMRFIEARTAPYKNIWEKIRSSTDIAEAIGKEIKSSDGNAVIYIRGLLPTPKMVRALRKRRKCLVVFELQSFVEREAALRSSWETVFAMKLFYGKVLRYADGIVGVTNEIALHYFKMSKRRDLPYLVNGNGIDVNSVPIRTPPPFDGKNLDLLCLAQVAKWHGLDRLIKGMAEYKGDVNVRLHIVGDGSEVPNLKRLVADLKLENSVAFHGFKTGKELDGFFDKCHIAVGSLGVHRNGNNRKESSTLKAREYCARGIPFIYEIEDPEITNKIPEFVLKFPSDESPVEIHRIVEYAFDVLPNVGYTYEMRKFAEDNLDWRTKMSILKSFLEGLSRKEGSE